MILFIPIYNVYDVNKNLIMFGEIEQN